MSKFVRPVVVAVLLCLGGWRSIGAQVAAAPVSPRDLSKWEQVAHDLYKDLLEINTEESIGSTAQAARAMATRLKAAGFPDSDVVVVENAPRKGNLVARLRARKAVRQPVLLLSHIDVVEAKPEDWTLAPFQLTEKDGAFFARGVADNKDDAAIGVALIMRLKAEGYSGDRDIIVALTTDEEGGPANGVDYLLKNRPELLQAEFAINEGGSGSVKDGKKISHDVQASEKKVANFQLEVTNPGGHSSVPLKENAITRLSAALVRVGAYDFPVRLNDVTRTYFSRSAALMEPAMGAAMRAIVANPGDAAAAAIISSDPRFNAQLRTTCVATMLEGGHAMNALPQRARATVNCRLLPDDSQAEVQRGLEAAVADPLVRVTATREAVASPPSPLTPELLGQVEHITSQMWPGVPVIPTMSTGATDGRFLRTSGIPTYGVMGQFYGDSNQHGMNERVPQQAFYDSFEFLYRFVSSITRPYVP